MTQQDPSREGPEAEASGQGRAPRPIPSHQSRPGREDDISLETGRPAYPHQSRPSGARSGAGRASSARAGAGSARATSSARPGAGSARTTGSASESLYDEAEPIGRQERIRRQPGRRAWVPNQHGAWMMLLAPIIAGWIVGGWSWAHLLFVPAWWSAYGAFWAWSQWLRTRSPNKRVLLVLPLLTYTSLSMILTMLTLIAAPYLLQFAIPLAPLFAIAIWQVWSGHERSLLSGISTTTAASLMAALMYSMAVGGAGGFLGTGSGLVVGTEGAAMQLPGASPNGSLTGWAWMWLVTAILAAYFGETVPYIKCMIRERFNYLLLGASVLFHAVVAGAMLWAGSQGYVSTLMAGLWVLLTARALVLPLVQWQLVRSKRRPLRPLILGVTEIVFSILLLIAIAV